jgi:hypothetical protein
MLQGCPSLPRDPRKGSALALASLCRPLRNQYTSGMNPFPRRLGWPLRGACLLAGLAVLIYPWLPAEWFIARNPATGPPFVFNQSHTLRAPLQLLWALEGFRRFPVVIRGTLAAMLAALVLTPTLRPVRPSDAPASALQAPRRPARWLAVGAGLVAAGFFYLLRVSYAQNARFADAPILPNEVDIGWVDAAEVLTFHAFYGVRGLLAWLAPNPSAVLAIAVTSCLAGGVFVSALVVLARAAARTSRETLLLLAGILLAGYTVMFFGYVETTQLALAMMAVYLAASARTLRAPPGPERTLWLTLALAGLALALLSHAAGILLLPSAVVLLLGESAGSACTWPGLLRRACSVRNAGLVGAVVLLPYLLVVALPFYAQGEFGNIPGGGDSIMLVPWRCDPAHPPSEYVYYAMFSGWHLADLLSALLVAAPGALPLAICGGYLLRGARLPAEDRWWLRLLAAAAGPCLLVPLLWNHDFGLRGDWNLAACYLFPLNVWAWSLFAAASRPWHTTAGFGRQIILPALLVQAMFAAGLLWPLW